MRSASNGVSTVCDGVCDSLIVRLEGLRDVRRCSGTKRGVEDNGAAARAAGLSLGCSFGRWPACEV